MATDTPRRLNLALVGLGNQGQEHLIGMRDSQFTRFIAGVDPVAAQRELTQQRYPQLQVFAGLQELAAAGLAVDGLVLCLPHHCYQQTWPHIAALQLPVLKEKPLARSLEEARELLASLPGKRLKTAIQRRHHASYQFLQAQLQRDQARVSQANAWLHLGRTASPVGGDWRSQQAEAGGGILLDAGYHLVDLLHFLVGPVELINCTTWTRGQRSAAGQLEDEALLLARNAHCWVMIDTRLGGEPGPDGALQKSEGIRLATDRGVYQANRTQVWHQGECLWQGEQRWEQAMARQLDEFAQDILHNRWDASSYWDQLPAMQLIESAYQLSRRY